MTTNTHNLPDCLRGTRISSWQKQGNNAFSFKVLFVSDHSGAGSLLYFEMVKQPDGEWLLYQIA